MNVLILQEEEYYTYLSNIFSALKNEQLKYNWLITDCECYPNDKNIDDLLSQKYVWASGKELSEIISKEDPQFIWGVFLGFNSDISLEDVLKYDIPLCEYYKDVIEGNVITKHPLSELEIIAWDSSLALLITKDNRLAENIKKTLA